MTMQNRIQERMIQFLDFNSLIMKKAAFYV